MLSLAQLRYVPEFVNARTYVYTFESTFTALYVSSKRKASPIPGPHEALM